MPRVPTDPTAFRSGEPQWAIIGMTLDDARHYLAIHGLTLVVTARDGADVPDADLKPRGLVLVAVRGTEVVAVNGRT
jgi:hypothetical protein